MSVSLSWTITQTALRLFITLVFIAVPNPWMSRRKVVSVVRAADSGFDLARRPE
ncbi:hypothetical protein ACGFRB_13190 [Streptomyces sp. NPDC048718]|uniref:hypothetical protein n=1 Tax=Streptomyces sp. NPDC048718 TaxID=3365587 RepID=UPI00371D7B03